MTAAAKVGIFMLVILAILGFFILRIEEIKIGRGSATRKIIAEFDSVAGLDAKATVRVAGVRKGKVTDIELTEPTSGFGISTAVLFPSRIRLHP